MNFKKKKVAILGSTGSIGKYSLEILKKHSKLFDVEFLLCNKNKKIIYKQIKYFSPKYVFINDFNTYKYFKHIKFPKKIIFINKFNQINKKLNFDVTILAISGIEGLDYALFFLKCTRKLLIANKESIVCGGKYLLSQAKKYKCHISSIDSEHYCINYVLKNYGLDNIEKIYLTASGGPFLNLDEKKISKINSKYALKHPTWKMGKKISIDSSTMANKILEIMEASILYNIDPAKISIKIHKESKVHCAIVFKNGISILVAHNTSMKIPIENSLFDNNIIRNNKNNFFNNKKNFNFTFDELNLKKFKIIEAGRKALNFGPRGCIFFNVINDFLVEKYLNDKIFFYEIAKKLNKVFNIKKLQKYLSNNINNHKEINDTINYAKKIISNI